MVNVMRLLTWTYCISNSSPKVCNISEEVSSPALGIIGFLLKNCRIMKSNPLAAAATSALILVFVLTGSHVTHAYITFPAATAALKKLPGFEGISLSTPVDANSFMEQLSKTPGLIQTDFQNLLQQASIIAKSVPAINSPEISNLFLSINNIVDQVGTKLGAYENGAYIGYALIALLGLTFVSILGKMGKSPSDRSFSSEPYGSAARYNPTLAAEFFSSRPLLVFNRGVEIGAVASFYAIGLLSDLISGKLTDAKQEEKRADQLTKVLTNLGPTFIKVGQSLSIRTDLLRPAYIKGLTKLQDCVPSFDTAVAREIIERELGSPADTIFISGIEPSAKVVAAASLGQVYKAVLRSDFSEVRSIQQLSVHDITSLNCSTLHYSYFSIYCPEYPTPNNRHYAQVAIKVQRPDILGRVALDMHLLRILSVPIKALAGLQTDLAGVIDDWLVKSKLITYLPFLNCLKKVVFEISER